MTDPSENDSASRSAKNPVWAELVQLIPVISFALPFVSTGAVDVERAGQAFLPAAVLTVVVSSAVVLRGHLLNPILVGTAAWLWLGALAFLADVEDLQAWLIDTQAFGLFVGALLAGVAVMLLSPWGVLATRGVPQAYAKRASFGLLGLSVVAMAWAWWFRSDIRVGGGLPFIVLNVVRRVLIVRAPAP